MSTHNQTHMYAHLTKLWFSFENKKYLTADVSILSTDISGISVIQKPRAKFGWIMHSTFDSNWNLKISSFYFLQLDSV